MLTNIGLFSSVTFFMCSKMTSLSKSFWAQFAVEWSLTSMSTLVQSQIRYQLETRGAQLAFKGFLVTMNDFMYFQLLFSFASIRTVVTFEWFLQAVRDHVRAELIITPESGWTHVALQPFKSICVRWMECAN